MGRVFSGLEKWLVANKQLQGGITNTRWPLTQHMEGGTGSSLQRWSLGSWTAQVDWKSREAVNILGIGTHLGNNVVPKSVVITHSHWGLWAPSLWAQSLWSSHKVLGVPEASGCQKHRSLWSFKGSTGRGCRYSWGA